MTKLTTTTTTILFTLFTSAVVFLYGSDSDAREFSEYSNHYPICSPIAHVIQESWLQGELTRAEAEEIIESCLAWEDRN